MLYICRVLLLMCLPCSLNVATEKKSLSALSVVGTPEPGESDGEADVVDEAVPDELEVFQPTSQWQTLRPGQAVPAGSHVRLNLQTGQREVKLDDHEALKYSGSGKRKGSINTQKSLFMGEELKKALAKLKDDGAQQKDEDQKKADAELRAQYRSLEVLKEDMAQLDMLLETEFQVMSRLVAKFNHTRATMEEKVAALRDLEYLVHQVDNAQDFVSMGGMKLVIDALNDTDLQESAAFVLGSAVSSNPRVQVEAVEAGALQKLLTLLATNHPFSVKKKVLFAVSCLLRNFPFAQQHFLKLGGIQVLGDLFRTTGGGALRIRVITLLYDMIVEKELITQVGLDPVPDSSHQERVRQYAQVLLLPTLAEQGWCGLVPELLASPEHDWREKALRTLLAIMSQCRSVYLQDQRLEQELGALQEQYRQLVLSETVLGEEDGYFGEILELLDTVLMKIR